MRYDGRCFVSAEYPGVEGFVKELQATVRECIDCGCLTPGGPTRCKRCAEEWGKKIGMVWNHFTKQYETEEEATKRGKADPGTDLNIVALVKLSEDLMALGLRNLDPSAPKAAILAIKTLKAKLDAKIGETALLRLRAGADQGGEPSGVSGGAREGPRGRRRGQRPQK